MGLWDELKNTKYHEKQVYIPVLAHGPCHVIMKRFTAHVHLCLHRFNQQRCNTATTTQQDQ